jgi:hypothetical protein
LRKKSSDFRRAGFGFQGQCRKQPILGRQLARGITPQEVSDCLGAAFKVETNKITLKLPLVGRTRFNGATRVSAFHGGTRQWRTANLQQGCHCPRFIS